MNNKYLFLLPFCIMVMLNTYAASEADTSLQYRTFGYFSNGISKMENVNIIKEFIKQKSKHIYYQYSENQADVHVFLNPKLHHDSINIETILENNPTNKRKYLISKYNIPEHEVKLLSGDLLLSFSMPTSYNDVMCVRLYIRLIKSNEIAILLFIYSKDGKLIGCIYDQGIM